MLQHDEKIKLTDLIDIEFLQKFQDFFAKIMGVASISVDEVGPITKPSNFTDFCIKYTRESKEGYKRCNKCDIDWGKVAAKSGKPVIYECHAGLTDFAVPIIVGGHHIASILGGQVLTEPPNIEHFRALARELGINQDEYVEAIKKIKIVPKEKVDAAANFLYLVANAISKISLKNLELIKKNQREDLYKNATGTIRSSLDIDQTKQKIVTIIGKTFGADRCFIAEYDKLGDKVLPIKDEYLSSKTILSYKGVDINEIAPDFIKLIKDGNSIIVNNKKIQTKDTNKSFHKEKKIIKGYKDYSSYTFPLRHSGELIGGLSISYIKAKHEIQKEEIELLNMIAEQIATAIYQAKIFNLTQKSAERESLLRNITEKLRSSLDIDKTLAYICEETAKVFNVQRSAISVFPEPENYENFILKKEYKISSEIKGIVQEKKFSKMAAYWGKILLSSNKTIAFDNVEESDTPNYFKEAYNLIGVKSLIGTAIRKGKDVWGTLVLSEYKNYRPWSEEEKTLLKTIADQIYIAINQVELLEKAQKTAQRETLLRRITETIRSSLDINEMKNKITYEIGKALNADRCVIMQYDSAKQSFLEVDEHSQYIIDDEIGSHKGFNLEDEDLSPFKDLFFNQRKELLLNDVEAASEFVDSRILNKLKELKVKSNYTVLITYRKQFLGILYVNYIKQKKIFSTEEIELFRSLANQSAIALNQAKLFEDIQKTAENEKTLKEIMLASVSTFNIEVAMKSIVTEAGKLFIADRCFYIGIDLETSSNLPIKDYAEYLSSENIVSHTIRQPNKSETEGFIKQAKQRNAIYVNDINKEDLPEASKKMLEELSVKSYLIAHVYYGDRLYGTIVFHYVNNYKYFSQDEIDMATAIANQSAIVIHQAELFEKEKETAQREIILRKVIETLRSSLNLIEVKKKITYELGTIFKADRCYFRTYDGTINKFLAPDVEYLSSPDVKSLLDVEPDQEGLKYFVDQVKKQKKRFYPVVVNKEFAKGTPLEGYMNSSGIIADYAIPIVNRQDELLWLVLHYEKEDANLNEDYKKLLETIGYQIDIAFEQINLYNSAKKTSEKESILRGITEKIRSSLDIDETLSFICYEMAKVFNVDRVAIAEFLNKGTYTSVEIRKEYKKRSEIKSPAGIENYKKVGEFIANQFSTTKKPIIIDNIDKSNYPKFFRTFYKNLEVKSLVGYHIKKSDKSFILITLSQIDEYKIWTQEDISLIESISDQIYTAINQAELFEELKQSTAKQNAILNNMPFMAWLKDKENRFLAVNEEFAKMCDDSINNIIGKTDFDYFPKEHSELYTQEDKLVMELKQTITNVELITDKNGERWHETFKSPVFDEKGKVIGTAGLSRDITERRETEIEILNKQKEILEANEREKILRETIEILRSTLDVEEIKKYFTQIACNYFNADRCLFDDFNKKTGEFLPFRIEILRTPEIKSLIGTSVEDEFPEFALKLKNGKNIIIKDLEKTLARKNLPNYKAIKTLHKSDAKSDYGLLVQHKNEIMGILILHFIDKKRALNHEEFTFLKMLRNQAGVALYQAELYENTKKQAEREKALRKITNIIRNSLDINEIKSQFVTEVGKYFDSNRCFIYEFGQNIKSGIYFEYTSSPEINKMSEADFAVPQFKYWEEIMFSTNINTDTLIDNLEQYILDNNLQNTPIDQHRKEFNIKTAIGVPIVYYKQIYGALIIQYTEDITKISNEDLNFMKILSEQAALALHQAELYKITQIQAEREKISRNIIEILRSTLDKNIIKRLFVKNIGKFFNADRVIFSLYDEKTNMYLPADEGSEYLSSPTEKSFVGYDWSKSEAREFIQPLTEKRELLIHDWDEYIKTNSKGQDFIDLFENSNVKSSYNFPVVYQQKIMGFFRIEFTQTVRKLSDEDINIIRNICTQAGIALYHSDLYEEAQKSTQAHAEFLTKLSAELKTPINMIVEFSQLLLKSEFEHSEDVEHLNKIYENAKKLLYLLDDSFRNAKINFD